MDARLCKSHAILCLHAISLRKWSATITKILWSRACVEKDHSLTCLDYSSELRLRQASAAQLNLRTGAIIKGPAILPNAFRQACCNESVPTIIESMVTRQQLLATLGGILKGSVLPMSQNAPCLKGPLQQPIKRLQALEPALWSPDRSAFAILAAYNHNLGMRVGLLTIATAGRGSVLAQAEGSCLIGPCFCRKRSIGLAEDEKSMVWSSTSQHLAVVGKCGSIFRLWVLECSRQQQRQQEPCLTVPIRHYYSSVHTVSWSPSGQMLAVAWCSHYDEARSCTGGAVFEPHSAAWLFKEEQLADRPSDDQAQLIILKDPSFWAAWPPGLKGPGNKIAHFLNLAKMVYMPHSNSCPDRGLAMLALLFKPSPGSRWSLPLQCFIGYTADERSLVHHDRIGQQQHIVLAG